MSFMNNQQSFSRETRKDGKQNLKPLEFRDTTRARLGRTEITTKEVSIGNHPATAHFASAAQVFIPKEELYVPRRSRR